MRIVASCATIPPRIKDGSVFRFIDSMLKQTVKVELIYVNIPTQYQRFDNTEMPELIRNLGNHDPRVRVSIVPLDCPVIKHIGAFNQEEGETFQFVGDDDQVYHPYLIERMLEGYFDKEAVMQNRMYMVCTGTGGIIHGFVGLMYKMKHLEGFFDGSFSIPRKCWIDDQLMSIYFHKRGTRIIPSPVHHYRDIYWKLDDWHEMTGGEESLHKLSGNRKADVKELERFYRVKFIATDDVWQGKGDIVSTRA